MGCGKAQGFLAQHGVGSREIVDARRHPIAGAGALAVLEGVTRLKVAKGKRVVEVDLRTGRPADAELLSLLLGPTGNLRAPTLRVGTTLIVGFNPESYAAELLA